MSSSRIAVMSVLAGLAAILAIGRLQALEPQLQERRAATALSAPQRPVTLSEDNLAEVVAAFRLKERISRVDWEHEIFSVDLMLREDEKEPAALWSDLAGLIRFSFGESGNIRQMLVRVYREKDGRRTLLFYGDPQKQDWPEEDAAAFRSPESASDAGFLRRFGLSSTPAGESWLRNLAN